MNEILNKIWKAIVSGLVVGLLAAITAWIADAQQLSPLYALIVVAALKALQKLIDGLYAGSILLGNLGRD